MNINYHFGELKCDGDILSYSLRGESWQIAIHDIKLIAEFAAPAGPLVEDYFLVFMTSLVKGWHQASFYARGRDATLSYLEDKLAGSIETDVAPSSETKSRILWPDNLKGNRLWDAFPKLKEAGESLDPLDGPPGLQLSPAARTAFLP